MRGSHHTALCAYEKGTRQSSMQVEYLLLHG